LKDAGPSAAKGRISFNPKMAKGQEMASEVNKYWYAIAVLRDADEVEATVDRLRSSRFGRSDLLMLADGSDDGVDASANGCERDNDREALSPALHSFLRAMKASESELVSGTLPRGREDQSKVFAHLRQDVAKGAVVLVASAAGPEHQLEGARVLLRGNSECVLTHEIVDASPSSA
jgi:hypothetical protein